MKRIVFLDYIRVFACFLVMLVHAAENFYGAPGSTDMAGPQSLLLTESDRLWVSLYDGFSRMSVPLFMIVSAFLLVPMREGQSAMEFYRRRAVRILPPFFIFIILYSTVPMLWNQIDGATSAHDLSRALLNFPTLAGHLWFMYPLIGLYLFIPMISPWLAKATAKEERFFIWLLPSLPVCLILTAGVAKCGDSVSGMSFTLFGISPVIWVILCLPIIYVCILIGAFVNVW